RGTTTRPATARVRQSIFSRLNSRLDISGTRVLDLFAGSGSLAIEALSRGAAHATMVDTSPAAAAAIQRNLETLGLQGHGRILASEVKRALATLAGGRERFDIIFIDAPYRADTSADILSRIVDLDLLSAEGWIVVRQYRRAAMGEPAAGIQCESVATLGDHRIALYRRAAMPNS
ncbi:MAG: 16S rRNA (guanine(966)-N(2))-methyltransferase RsmD, partial [Candidatus Binataceae bacterium]